MVKSLAIKACMLLTTVLLVVWIGWQVLSQSLVPASPTAGGVAYGAHIGGFIAGALLISLFRKYRRGRDFSYL